MKRIAGESLYGFAFTGQMKSLLFPLDGAWRLRADIKNDPVDASDLVNDPAGDRPQDIIGDPCLV